MAIVCSIIWVLIEHLGYWLILTMTILLNYQPLMSRCWYVLLYHDIQNLMGCQIYLVTLDQGRQNQGG